MFPSFHRNESEKCQKWYFWQISDSFQQVRLTVFWHIFESWYISDPFPKLFWYNSDTFLQVTDIWQLSDTYLTDFWQIFATDSFLTDFWQISDRFPKVSVPTLSKSTKNSVSYSQDCEEIGLLSLCIRPHNSSYISGISASLTGIKSDNGVRC